MVCPVYPSLHSQNQGKTAEKDKESTENKQHKKDNRFTDRSMAGSVDVKYDEALVKSIQELFTHKIVPENFLIAVHKYNSDVLTMSDIQRLRKCLDQRSSLEVNYELLTTMKNYRGWFKVILDVCKDSEVKQSYLVEEFERLKSELDKSRSQAQEDDLAAQISIKYELEADAATVGSPPAREPDPEDGSEPSIEHQPGVKEAWTMSDGKGYCNVCAVELTSEKLKESHIAGRNHLKKMKEKGFNSSFGEAKSVRGAAEKGFNSSFGEAKSVRGAAEKGFNSSFGEAKSVRGAAEKGFNSSFGEAKSVRGAAEKGFNSSFDEAKSVEGAAEKGFNSSFGEAKSVRGAAETAINSSFDEAQSVEGAAEKGFNSSFDEAKSVGGAAQKGFNSSFDEVRTSSGSFSDDWIKYCEICVLPLTSAPHSRQHMDGAKHKKKVAEARKEKTSKPAPTLGPNGEVYSVNPLGVGMCFLCGVSITSKENADLHLSGRKHKNMCKEHGVE